MQPGTHRRDFVKQGAAGLMILSPGALRAQASSAISLGLIGCGNRGTYVGGLFAKNEFVKITAVCDIYDDKLKKASGTYSGAKATKDYHEILNSNVDAVLIATPAYLHPEHFEAAVKARKHIFLEKPVAVDAAGCRRVYEAARKADPSKRISVDLQQRYGKDYRKCHQVVKSGDLGAVKMVRAAWIGGGPPLAKGHPPSEERMRNWFFYRELSGDILIEQDCHNIDVVNWFMGKHPVRVNGYGSRQVRMYGDIYDNLSCSFQFDDGLIFSYSANQFRAPGFSDVSETFMCERGAVNVSRRGYTIWREKGEPEVGKTTHDITLDHVNEFVEDVRTGKLGNDAFHAVDSTLTAVMALQACVQGREMTWEDVWKA